MYSKSTSSLTLWSDKVLSFSSMKHSHLQQHQNRKAISNSELGSDLPDLSHLSDEERKIIQAVIERQKVEEENDLKSTQISIKSNTNQNFNALTSRNNSLLYNDQIKFKKSQRHSISDIAQEIKQRYGSVDTGNVCDVCKKIKFTNSSVGRICFSCKSRCCVRCSLKYISKTKEIWICLICKKKQDDLIQNSLTIRKKNSIIENVQVNHTNLKRKLPNLIYIKQLSQDESSTGHHETDSILTNRWENSSKPIQKSDRISMSLIKQTSLTNQPCYLKDFNEINVLKKKISNKHSSNQELKNYLISEISFSSDSSSISHINSSCSNAERIIDPSTIFRVTRDSNQINSIPNLTKLNKIDSDKALVYKNENSVNILQKNKEVQNHETHNNNSTKSDDLHKLKNSVDKTFQEKQKKGQELNMFDEKFILAEKTKKHPPFPVLLINKSFTKNKLLTEIKQSSLNISDDENQSEEVQLVDIENNLINNINEQRYQTKEENEKIHSITEFTTNDETEFESANLTSKYISYNKNYENSQQDKMCTSVDNCLVQNLSKEEILAHRVNKLLSPINWKITADGNKMIGHIVLKKSMINISNSLINSSSNSTIDSATDFNLSLSFGMKVIGGRPDPITHQLGAYIIKLKQDSIAETIGRLQVNDEIIKWNGKLLRGLSFDEVYSIINKSKQEAQIDLIVERRLNNNDAYDSMNMESNIYFRNAELTNVNNLKVYDKIKSLGKIQLKIFHDSKGNKLYVNILTISINQNNIILDFIFCKIRIFTSIKIEIFSKTSDRYKFEETVAIAQVSETFTFEPVDQNLLNELTIQLEVINYQNKQTIGKVNLKEKIYSLAVVWFKSEFFITPGMFENNLIDLEIFKSIEKLDSKPVPSFSVESFNSGSLNSRRRQLPQIPVSKSNETNEINSSDLVQDRENLKLKIERKKYKNNSISESQVSVDHAKVSIQSNNQNKTEPKHHDICDFLYKRASDIKDFNQDFVNCTNGFKELERYNEFKNKEYSSAKYPNQRRVTCANSDEIKKKLNPKNNIQLFSFENFPNDKIIEKPDCQRIMQNSEETECQNYENIPKTFFKASSNPLIDFEENSLYLNKASSIRNNNLTNSSSQTFFTKINNIGGSSNGSKPEKLFSTSLLNQRTQNAVFNSSKIASQNQSKSIGVLESDGLEKKNSCNVLDLKFSYDNKNKGAQEMAPSINFDSNSNRNGEHSTNQINENMKNEKNDGTVSDSALTNCVANFHETGNKKRRPSMAKALVILGLSKKSNSASNLTCNKRFGFARSEEYGMMPELRNLNLSPSSAAPSTEEKKPRLWSGALKLPHEKPFNEFVENLGPGQKISRQVLGLPCLGEIKLEMSIQNHKLTIQVFEVKKLKPKIGHRMLPNVYIKFYLYNGVLCIEKQKTSMQRRTLNPVFNQSLRFESDYQHKILQLTVWGDYGKLDKKCFLGIAQVVLDDCNLAEQLTGWYKLYPASSIITDFSSIASTNDFSQGESGYTIS